MRGAGASMARSQVATAQATTTPSARSKAGRRAHSRLRGPSGQLAGAPSADPTAALIGPCLLSVTKRGAGSTACTPGALCPVYMWGYF